PKAAGVSATDRAAALKLRSFAAAVKQRSDSIEGSIGELQATRSDGLIAAALTFSRNLHCQRSNTSRG
ncbi:MAG: hypothetical protein QOI41_235, partial [Myxococcales bacterium]|nr:hypothetical protein [Myxococcales bacterium]